MPCYTKTIKRLSQKRALQDRLLIWQAVKHHHSSVPTEVRKGASDVIVYEEERFRVFGKDGKLGYTRKPFRIEAYR